MAERTTTRHLPRAAPPWPWPLGISVAIMVTDWWLSHWYRLHPITAIVMNRGLGFGLGRAYPALTFVLAGLGTVALTFAYAKCPAYRYPLATALGGALANLGSRLRYGAVVDYWHIAPYPYTFNLADVAIRTALVYVVAMVVLGNRRTRDS